MRMNDRLYFKLNNRLENEVAVIEYGESQRLVKHYGLLAMLSLRENVSAGHIYAVLTYLWSFAFSLDDMPRLVEKFSELKDIGKRVEV